MHVEAQSTVVHVDRVDVSVRSGEWAYAEKHAQAIADHWGQRSRANPHYWNGVVHVLTESAIEGHVFRGTYARTDFAAFLHWREAGYPLDAGRDCFGSAVVRSAEGYVLLGVSGYHTVNAGQAFPPGGFVDQADIRPDGRVDVDGCIRRELLEEIGLTEQEVTRAPGYWLTMHEAQVSMAIEVRSALPGAILREQLRQRLGREDPPELRDLLLVRSVEEARTLPGILPFARALTARVLSSP